MKVSVERQATAALKHPLQTLFRRSPLRLRRENEANIQESLQEISQQQPYMPQPSLFQPSKSKALYHHHLPQSQLSSLPSSKSLLTFPSNKGMASSSVIISASGGKAFRGCSFKRTVSTLQSSPLFEFSKFGPNSFSYRFFGKEGKTLKKNLHSKATFEECQSFIVDFLKNNSAQYEKVTDLAAQTAQLPSFTPAQKLDLLFTMMEQYKVFKYKSAYLNFLFKWAIDVNVELKLGSKEILIRFLDLLERSNVKIDSKLLDTISKVFYLEKQPISKANVGHGSFLLNESNDKINLHDYSELLQKLHRTNRFLDVETQLLSYVNFYGMFFLTSNHYNNHNGGNGESSTSEITGKEKGWVDFLSAYPFVALELEKIEEKAPLQLPLFIENLLAVEKDRHVHFATEILIYFEKMQQRKDFRKQYNYLSAKSLENYLELCLASRKSLEATEKLFWRFFESNAQLLTPSMLDTFVRIAWKDENRTAANKFSDLCVMKDWNLSLATLLLIPPSYFNRSCDLSLFLKCAREGRPIKLSKYEKDIRLYGIVKNGNTEQIQSFVKFQQWSDEKLTYTTFENGILAACETGQIGTIVSFLREIKTKSLGLLDRKLFQDCIDLFGMHNNHRKHGALIDILHREFSPVFPSHFERYLQVAAQNFDLTEVLKVISILKASGFHYRNDDIVASAILQLSFHTNGYRSTNNFFEDLITNGNHESKQLIFDTFLMGSIKCLRKDETAASKILGTLHIMQHEGLRLSSNVFCALFDNESFWKFDKIPFFSALLSATCKFSLSEDLDLKVKLLERIFQSLSSDKASAEIEWILMNDGPSGSWERSFLSNCLLTIHSGQGNETFLWRTLNMMPKYDIPFTDFCIERIIDFVSREDSDVLENFFDFFNFMIKDGFEPSVENCAVIIQSLDKSKQPRAAEEFYNYSLENELFFSLKTKSLLLKNLQDVNLQRRLMEDILDGLCLTNAQGHTDPGTLSSEFVKILQKTARLEPTCLPILMSSLCKIKKDYSFASNLALNLPVDFLFGFPTDYQVLLQAYGTKNDLVALYALYDHIMENIGETAKHLTIPSEILRNDRPNSIPVSTVANNEIVTSASYRLFSWYLEGLLRKESLKPETLQHYFQVLPKLNSDFSMDSCLMNDFIVKTVEMCKSADIVLVAFNLMIQHKVSSKQKIDTSNNIRFLVNELMTMVNTNPSLNSVESKKEILLRLTG